MENFITPTKQDYNRKFFSAITKRVQDLFTSKMQNKFEKDSWKTFQVIVPTRKC